MQGSNLQNVWSTFNAQTSHGDQMRFGIVYWWSKKIACKLQDLLSENFVEVLNNTFPLILISSKLQVWVFTSDRSLKEYVVTCTFK